MLLTPDAAQALLGLGTGVITSFDGASPGPARDMARAALAHSLAPDVTLAVTEASGRDLTRDAMPTHTVCVSALWGTAELTCRVQLSGTRAEVRRASTSLALHALRALLGDERLAVGPPLCI